MRYHTGYQKNGKSEAYSESCQTSKMEHFANVFTKRFILDVWQGSE